MLVRQTLAKTCRVVLLVSTLMLPGTLKIVATMMVVVVMMMMNPGNAANPRIYPEYLINYRGLGFELWPLRRARSMHEIDGTVLTMSRHTCHIYPCRVPGQDLEQDVNPHILHACVCTSLFNLCIAWLLCCCCRWLHWCFAARACNHFVASGMAPAPFVWTDFLAQAGTGWNNEGLTPDLKFVKEVFGNLEARGVKLLEYWKGGNAVCLGVVGFKPRPNIQYFDPFVNFGFCCRLAPTYCR